MSRNDYFADLREGARVQRELTYRGRTRTVHFRRVTAGERAQLLQGQTVDVGEGGKPRSVDLGDFTTRRHLLVQFSLVKEDGSNVYASLEQVQAEPEDLVDALYELATTAFEEAEPGNA